MWARCRLRKGIDAVAKYDVSYPAQVQVERLSPTEKKELLHLFADPNLDLTTKKVAPSGNSVSRLGSTKRVVWKRSDNGKPVILSVVDRAQDEGNGCRPAPWKASVEGW
jgi:hypothetical protein